MRPSLSGRSPVTARIRVVFPAPFGPSRPVTPGPNEHDRSVSATFCPNHTDACCTVTVASGANAGSRPRRRDRGRDGGRRRRSHNATSR